MSSFMMYAPTRVLFGAGQLSHLHEQTLPGKSAEIHGHGWRGDRP